MTEPFLALITPIGASGGAPQPPLGIWGPTDPRPTHPIAGYPWPTPPQPPLGIWGPTDPRPTPPIYAGGGGPVDPGYSPPWARPQPPYPDNALPGNQPYPDNTLPGSQPRPDHGLPPFPAHPWVPPQSPVIDPIDPTKAYIVAYAPKSGGGYERITFTVDMPAPGEPPTEATPKG